MRTPNLLQEILAFDPSNTTFSQPVPEGAEVVGTLSGDSLRVWGYYQARTNEYKARTEELESSIPGLFAEAESMEDIDQDQLVKIAEAKTELQKMSQAAGYLKYIAWGTTCAEFGCYGKDLRVCEGGVLVIIPEDPILNLFSGLSGGVSILVSVGGD